MVREKVKGEEDPHVTGVRTILMALIERLDSVESKKDKIESKVGRLESKVDMVEERLSLLEESCSTVRASVERTETKTVENKGEAATIKRQKYV